MAWAAGHIRVVLAGLLSSRDEDFLPRTNVMQMKVTHDSLAHQPLKGRGAPQRGAAITIATCLFARVVVMGALNLLQDLTEVVALGGLERWELLVGLEMPQPHLLTDRQKVEIVLERGHRRAYGTTDNHGALHINSEGLFEGIALDVLHQGHVEGRERQDPTLRTWLRHGVVHLPVLVAHCRRCRTGEIVEVVAR